MDKPLAYLLNFLEEEFREFPEVRVRVAPKAGVMRSPDLPQDYDAESNDLHTRRGVTIQTRRSEFYFPEEWARNKDYSRIQALAEEIREKLKRH